MANKDWRSFVYGGASSVIAELGTFPIDTTKTRLQVQGQAGDHSLAKVKYKGMIDALVKISKEEGVLALYSGIWPAALRQAIYGTIKFGTYYSLKQFVIEHEIFEKKSDKGESVAVNMLCAASAGAISSAIANPTDVLKVRLQVQGSGEANLFRLFNEIYQKEGVRGLWRGVGPTAQRAVVLTGVELPLYDYIKNSLIGSLGDSVTNHTIASVISSLGGAICSCPIDVVRTRLMNQKVVKSSSSKSLGPHIYKGSIDCAIQTVKHEGFMALYKGFIPTWMRMGPWNVIFFITYEELMKLY